MIPAKHARFPAHQGHRFPGATKHCLTASSGKPQLLQLVSSPYKHASLIQSRGVVEVAARWRLPRLLYPKVVQDV